MALLHSAVGRYWRGAVVVAIATGFAAACASPPAVLTRLVEARRLASELHVQFTHAADAANRAVMADTDEGSAAAADAFRAALDAAVRAGAPGDSCCSRAIAARAETAILEIQVTYAPHIAESDDAAMTRMEGRMNACRRLKTRSRSTRSRPRAERRAHGDDGVSATKR